MTQPTNYNDLGHPATEPIARPLRPGWQERHDRYCARAAQGGVDLLFIGDSLTQRWETAPEVWEKYYAHRRAAQMGIDNDQTQNVLWRLDNGTIKDLAPKLIVLLIGINNLGNESSSPEETREGIAAVVRNLRGKFPASKILILAIFPYFGVLPFEDAAAQVRLTNQQIATLADGRWTHYLDIGRVFVSPDGGWRPEIQPDKAHLSTEGYRLYAEAIEPKVKELMGD